MNRLVQKAYGKCDIHIVQSDGFGYTLYCVDMAGHNRFFIEVYEELGDVIVYNQGKVYKEQEVDEETWKALDDVFSSTYKMMQEESGKYRMSSVEMYKTQQEPVEKELGMLKDRRSAVLAEVLEYIEMEMECIETDSTVSNGYLAEAAWLLMNHISNHPEFIENWLVWWYNNETDSSPHDWNKWVKRLLDEHERRASFKNYTRSM